MDGGFALDWRLAVTQSPAATVEAAPPQPPEFELERSDAYAQYILSNRVEILFVLRSLLKHQSLATLYFNDGRAFLLSSLLAIDEAGDSLILDFGSEEPINQAALKAKRLIFAAKLERIKIQFQLPGLEQVTFEGRPAFRARLPERLLRLQRREYFRLETPVSPILFCHTPIQREDGPPRTKELKILDLSGGGVSLMVPDDLADQLPLGSLATNCRIALPEEGMVVANLCVRSALAVTTRNGHGFTRLGCEFVNLPGPRRIMIQRFITRIERERKSRLAGRE